ncbi:MAG: hypothetical protein LQ338_003702 [Usnochroma carphineum]|nr:MAG: hypothetical protein LQ338_003702 [Usnochroma carphineum]
MGEAQGPRQASIPRWQQNDYRSSDSPNGESTPPESSKSTEPPPPRAALLEQASKFLQEDEIKDAPTDRKVAFLESKGLTEEEVQRLLVLPSDTVDGEAQKEAAIEETSSHSIPAQSQSETPKSATPSHSSPTDTPPIITYPEFLLHSREPPPLITASNFINTIYLFSGTAAAIYGTSKYIVNPLLESLTSARHEFLGIAQTNLDTLNDKLENTVSVFPEGGAKHSGQGEGAGGDDDADSDTTEDMAPLFNRTIGTQTSPPSSPSTSSTPSSSSSSPSLDAISAHENSLKSLHISLSSLLPKSVDRNISVSDVESKIDDLSNYLDSLAYPDLYGSRSAAAESKDDSVNKFKAEIRGVKGVLLSARNFPSGTGRVVMG